MNQYILDLSSGIRARTLWLGFNIFCVIHWPLFVMDRGQSLIIPPLFDDTNYAYWKVCMRAFLQFLDEKVWRLARLSQRKRRLIGMMLRSKKQTSIAGHWMFYLVRSLMRSSRKYPLLKLLRKHEPFSKQPMKEPRLSRIQNFRGLPRALKRLIWRRRSHSMSSMPI